MKLKDFLAVSGINEVYVYDPIKNRYGNIVDYDCLTEAEYKSKPYLKRKIDNIDAGRFFFDVYLTYQEPTENA